MINLEIEPQEIPLLYLAMRGIRRSHDEVAKKVAAGSELVDMFKHLFDEISDEPREPGDDREEALNRIIKMREESLTSLAKREAILATLEAKVKAIKENMTEEDKITVKEVEEQFNLEGKTKSNTTEQA